MMQLHKVRGGNKEDLENRNYTICVGISLGNKWFTTDNVIELIRWSLQYSKDKVMVCPTDDIHAINLEVRKRVNPAKALELARRMSVETIDAVKAEAESVFSQDEKERIIYATWADVATEEFRQKVDWLYQYFEQDESFKKELLDIVRNFTANEERDFSNEDIEKFATYILEELPEVLSRVSIKGVICDAYAYPFDGILTELIENIQLGTHFPAIRAQIMDTEPKVFLEVR